MEYLKRIFAYSQSFKSCAYTLIKESMPIDVTDMRNGEKKVGNTAKSSQASERFFQITGDEVANWYFAMDCDMSGVASQ
jgi:hypothetical protein